MFSEINDFIRGIASGKSGHIGGPLYLKKLILFFYFLKVSLNAYIYRVTHKGILDFLLFKHSVERYEPVNKGCVCIIVQPKVVSDF